MKLSNSILTWMVLAIAASPALASGYPISAAQIAAEIDRMGMPVNPGEVILLADVTASAQNPILKVRSIQPQNGGEVLVRLECEEAGQCLPFFVRVRTGSAGAVPAKLNAPAPTRAVRPLRDSSTQAPVVKRGASAKLLLEGGHVHISIPVISLQDGAAGQTIRVTSVDHHQTYLAQVVDDTLLKGRL